MEQASPTPILELEFGVSKEVFTDCSRMMGDRIKNRNMPRTIVLGIAFIACALGTVAYLLFYLYQVDWKIIVMALALLLLGTYNLTYYPLLFPRLLIRRTERIYNKSPHLGKRFLLSFYEDYIEENAAGRVNRVQWPSIRSVDRGDSFYMLRLTADSGIIIPRSILKEGQQELLEELLEQKLAHGRGRYSEPA